MVKFKTFFSRKHNMWFKNYESFQRYDKYKNAIWKHKQTAYLEADPKTRTIRDKRTRKVIRTY